MNQLKLLEAIKERGFHSSIATTYSVDGAFYDSAIQHRLRTQECLNNIIIADASMLTRALRATPEAFTYAGRRYVVTSAKVNGCFHPKILLRLGRRRGSLHVSSANATAAGWCRNLELVGELRWEYGSEDPDNSGNGQLIRKVYDYLKYWLAPLSGQAIAAKLQIHNLDTPWLNELEPNDRPITNADGSVVDLLLERADGGAGILRRLVECVDGDRINRLILISPYWDSDLSALRELRLAFGEPPVIIALNSMSSEFPRRASPALDDVRFAPALSGNRFAHSKLVLLEGERADHVLFGSANISRAALGGLNESCKERRGMHISSPATRFRCDAPRTRSFKRNVTARGASDILRSL